MRVTKILTRAMPVYIIKKVKTLSMLASIAYYRKLLAKYAYKCGKEIQIHKPVSLRGLGYISIGDYFKLDVGSILEAWDEHNGIKFSPSIIIGNNVSFGKFCHIGCINGIKIGNNVLGGSNILIIDHNHGMCDETDICMPPNKRLLNSPGKISIGDNVWLGDKVTILPNVCIGNNTIIGANTVVTRSIPDNCIVVGNPARIIKIIKGERA